MQDPPLLGPALELARELGFERSSLPEVGRLLRVLAAGRFRIAQIGAGTGVGAAWIADALAPGAMLLAVEADPAWAEAGARLLEEEPGVRVVHGDWHELLPAQAPFDLVFFDGRRWQHEAEEESLRLLELIAPGGLVVVDGSDPPPAPRPRPWADDPVRRFWLAHPRLFETELLVTPRGSVILAARQPRAATIS